MLCSGWLLILNLYSLDMFFSPLLSTSCHQVKGLTYPQFKFVLDIFELSKFMLKFSSVLDHLNVVLSTVNLQLTRFCEM